MREYGRVSTAFWASADMRGLSCDGRMLALYLMTNPHSTQAGVCRLPDGYVCEDIQWDAPRVAQAFAELAACGFAQRCAATAWVWVCKHLEWNPPDNPNQLKAIRRAAASVPPSCAWLAEFTATTADQLRQEPAPTLPKAKKPDAQATAETPPNVAQPQQNGAPDAADGAKPAPQAEAASAPTQCAEAPELSENQPDDAFLTVSEPFRNGFGTTKPKPKTNTNTEQWSYQSSHDHSAHARGDDDENTAPANVAEWIQVWQRWGVEVSPTSIHDRKKFYPLATGWLSAGVTVGQMRQAVEHARQSSAEPIAYLPAYADVVLARLAAPPRGRNTLANGVGRVNGFGASGAGFGGGRRSAPVETFARASARHLAEWFSRFSPGAADRSLLAPMYSGELSADVLDVVEVPRVAAIACH